MFHIILPFGKSLIGQNRFWIGDGASRPIEILSQNTDLLKQFNNKIHWSNKNLVINWYLGNPINQLGLSSYSSGSALSLDRWCCDGTLTIENGYVTPTSNIYQTVSKQEVIQLVGKPLTLSALYADGTFETGTLTFPNTLPTKMTMFSASANQSIVVSVDNRIGITQIYRNSAKKSIVAVKTEVGTYQTLACLNENNKWILNDIMDYSEELAKCQAYMYNVFYQATDRYQFGGFAHAVTRNVAYVDITTPSVLNHRVANDVRIIGFNDLIVETLVDGDNRFLITNVALNRINNNKIKISVECKDGGLTIGDTYVFGVGSSNGYLIIATSVNS